MINDQNVSLLDLKKKIELFCRERDWDQFHAPKELAIGLVTEASELLELFRFKHAEEIQEKMVDSKFKDRVGEELADVFYFLIRFSQKYGVDLTSELLKKMEVNRLKYPVEKARGSNKKYNEL